MGSTDDVTPENHTSGILLAGGGGDNDEAMAWLINRADGGDIVVIRASETDGYNDYLFTELGITVNSVETILIDSREAAEHPYVEQQIRNAEALFIAGGDQYDYYQYWKDTPVMDAINYLLNDKGVAVGGTSAGMAILGKAYYTPSGTGAQSSTVLNNPYHSSTNIIGRDNFIDANILNNTITDTHFDARDRSGRLFTFMARMVTDWGIEAKGIAANEYTAVCIDVDGKA
ncbi:MAG TPA: cyanophycinase, partial [Tenuifilaceae bacterium]|nr:cyanophycinase [Tenuifilaceae bacterium]